MNMTNIKFIITILAMGLLYPYKPAQSQWYNTIDQQQQNAVIQSNQEALIRQQESRRQLERMNERAFQERMNRMQQFNNPHDEGNTFQYHQQIRRSY